MHMLLSIVSVAIVFQVAELLAMQNLIGVTAVTDKAA